MMDQGLFESGISWKPGHLYLTTKSLIFSQGSRVFFHGDLKNLVLVEIIKRKCILGKMVKQLKFMFKNRNVYIAIRNINEWNDAIAQVIEVDNETSENNSQ